MTANPERESKYMRIADHHFHCGFAVVGAHEATPRAAILAILLRRCSVPLKLLGSDEIHAFSLPHVRVHAAHA